MTIDPIAAVHLVNKWSRRLGMDKWQFRVCVFNEEHEADGHEDCEAYVDDIPAYEHATITLHGWQLDDEKAVETAIAHEVLHCLLAEERIAIRKYLPHKIADIIHERHINRIAEAFVALETYPDGSSTK